MTLPPLNWTALAATPVDRLRALARWDEYVASGWDLWLPVLATLVVGGLLVGLYAAWARRRRALAAFLASAARLGLSAEEQAALACVARLAGARPYGLVYADEAVFERGAAALAAGQAVEGVPAARLTALAAQMPAVRTKLGFAFDAAEGEGADGAARLQAKQRVTVAFRDGRTVAARVSRVDGRRVTLQVEAPADEATGRPCVLRTAVGRTPWEIDASIVAGAGELLVLHVVSAPRRADLRRFARVAADREVYLAPYPLVKRGTEETLPTFVPGRLREMGGPGLLVETDPAAEDEAGGMTPGQRALVVLKVHPKRTLEAPATVRRVETDGAGCRAVALELAGLTDEEVGYLVRETHALERRAAALADPEAGAPREAVHV